MVKKVIAGVIGGLLLGFSTAQAHFLLLKPDKIFVEGNRRNVRLIAKFTHPMERGPNMDFSIIKSGVFIRGKKEVLKWKTRWIRAMKKSSHKVRMYFTNYKIKRPGVYQFFIVPAPYFEPAEEKFIQQITKVYVEAFGMEEDWDKPIGLKAEIVPLIKPFAIWEGNTFRGRVYFNGKPARNIEVEVEYLNTRGVKVPADSFITQVVKTDENGYFEYTIPWAGWWGFSALGDGGTLEKNGKKYPVELDAVIWVKAYPRPRGVK